MTLTAVDCQGFAGGFTLGTVQAGFKLLAKLEMKGGFGVPNCEANRHLLGDDWQTQVSTGSGHDWDPPKADVLFGNPPCSGFSLMSAKNFRGSDSPINHCMWAFADTVVKTQPTVAVFESVQQAYTGGLDLMRDLRAWVEHRTGQRWDLYHVLHNAASVGGAAIRKRYFWVISRVPFGVERGTLFRVPVLDDVIGDLQGLGSTFVAQPYKYEPSWWAKSLRSKSGAVDGMAGRNTAGTRRALDLIPVADWGWKESLSAVTRRYYEKTGSLPESWGEQGTRIISKDFDMGFNQPSRWHPHKFARVVTGSGLDHIVHPWEDRFITHREVARIQGFPDDWTIWPLRAQTNLPATWGKGIPVQCGKWIADWISEAIQGRPGSYTGDPGGQDREWIINTTRDYYHLSDER